jgi:hypothetical protein
MLASLSVPFSFLRTLNQLKKKGISFIKVFLLLPVEDYAVWLDPFEN